MKTQFFGFALLFLLAMKGCQTTDPASLPNRPAFIDSSSSVSSSVSSPNTVSSSSALFSLSSISSTSLNLVPPSGAPANTHPLQIDAKRARDYPGSNITIESTLDPGSNYSRYYVSYLSDGLKIYA